ncbi:MAG: L,D-transpeptidase [Candidatus Competibacteraceae bacterium]|nr:L,D-transpeptidase [Candidatus Competibacteraceae bacterium]
MIKYSLRAILLALCCLSAVASADIGETWLLVDTRQKIISVMEGDRVVDAFGNIAMGASGAGIKQRQGDSKTPLGSFRVTEVRPSQRFRTFVGLDYPNQEYARQALEEGRISDRDYLAIVQALEEGRSPPADTPLGGLIGIHGVGGGSLWVHANFNWTEGCIALDNSQIDRLSQWVREGTRVEIR